MRSGISLSPFARPDVSTYLEALNSVLAIPQDRKMIKITELQALRSDPSLGMLFSITVCPTCSSSIPHGLVFPPDRNDNSFPFFDQDAVRGTWTLLRVY